MTIAPGPSSFQVIRQFLKDPLQMFADAQTEWGDVVRFAALGYELYQLTSVDLAQTMLTNPQFEMSVMMEHPFVGNGLANNIGESWKNQRRLMQPYFHQRAISDFGVQMVNETQHMLNQWQGKNVVDVLPELIRLNHQILAKTIINLDFYEHPELLAALSIIRHYLNQRFQALVTVPESIPTPRNLAFKKAVTVWDQAIRGLIAQSDDESSLLSLLRHAHDPKTDYRMTDEQLRDEVNTIFFNGYEDPGATVTWALHLLTQNPEAYQQLRDEISQKIGDQPPTVHDLSDMSYLENVINETLRLYPTTWAIMRDAQSDVKLGDYDIAKGAMVQATVYLLHRHPDYWESPDAFKPERFADDYPQAAYMPFGYGPRQCIGRAFAMMQIKLILITLLQRYHFEQVPQTIQIDAQASLRPKHGLKLTIQSA